MLLHSRHLRHNLRLQNRHHHRHPRPYVVTTWLSNLQSFHHSRLSRLVIGLDVEWLPSFCRGHPNPVATLQLCVGRRCLIFQILHADRIPSSLFDFFADDEFTFVGVGVKADLKKLDEDYNLDCAYANAVDLGRLAAYVYDERELRTRGLKYLASTVLGVEMEKPKAVALSRWDSWCLEESQIMYAAVDAIASFEIGFRLDAFEYRFDD